MDPRKITPLREVDITRSIAKEFYKQFDGIVSNDVTIVGGGPAGLVCGRELAHKGYNVLIVEQMAHLGGGFWSGGYLMTKAAIASPAHEMLVKLGVHCNEVKPGLHIVEAGHACSKLIGAASEQAPPLRGLFYARIVAQRGAWLTVLARPLGQLWPSGGRNWPNCCQPGKSGQLRDSFRFMQSKQPLFPAAKQPAQPPAIAFSAALAEFARLWV